MQARHPDWGEYQTANLLYWQGTTKKLLRAEASKFAAKYPALTVLPRNSRFDSFMDVTRTMAKLGEYLEWPARTVAYEITFAGTPTVDISDREWEQLQRRWPRVYAVRAQSRAALQGLQGLRFGHLLVERFQPGTGWVVRCECGRRLVINNRSVLIRSTGCGCPAGKLATPDCNACNGPKNCQWCHSLWRRQSKIKAP
jgi:hypothetical protein